MSNRPSLHSGRQAEEFLRFVREGITRRVKRALADGADIDGRGANLDYPPLVLAAERGLVAMVKLLLVKGADIDVAAPRDVPCGCPNDGCDTLYRVVSGTTALHTAVSHCRPDVIRLLLRSGGNPNVANSHGFTPLHTACYHAASADAMIYATILLEAGADPLLADACGRLPLHVAARKGHTCLVDMLVLKAPTTLNEPSSQGSTPLLAAARNGRETTVLRLLRLGAKQPLDLDKKTTCPLKSAVDENHGEVLRILLDHGMDAVGGAAAIPSAMGLALVRGLAKNLHALLSHFEGDDDARRHFARRREGGIPALNYAVSTGHLATVGVLLGAGADETEADNGGWYASEMVNWEDNIDLATKAALIRMLERGPAFRAASWRWPRWAASISFPKGAADGPISGFPGERLVGPLAVRIFRRTSKKILVRLVSRCAR